MAAIRGHEFFFVYFRLVVIEGIDQTNILKSYFSAERFSIHEDVSHEVVMDGREATTESLLSDGASLLSISAAIEQHHLHESIFRLSSKKITFSHINLEIAKKSLIFAAQN